jgi:two-component system phosphate regulon sensor histidine kinase PhoR
MHSSLRKIGLLILAIIILPVITFSIFEIGNLRQNEKVIQDIYKNQLDAILFSINTYSDDMISNFASRIENSLNSFKPDTTSELDRLLSENPSIISLMQFDATLKYLSSTPYSNPGNLPLSEITSKLHENTGTINRLQTYMRGGYRKIETLDSTIGNIQWLIFITHVNNQLVFNVLAVDPEKFISHVLDPKIQEIAKGKFHIVAYRLGEDLPFYSSNKQ